MSYSDRDSEVIGELHYTAVDPEDHSPYQGWAVIERDFEGNYSWYSPTEEDMSVEPFRVKRECLADYKRYVRNGEWKHLHFYWKEGDQRE